MPAGSLILFEDVEGKGHKSLHSPEEQTVLWIRPSTHKPGGVMRLKQCLLCPYSDRLRAAAQYVAMGQNPKWPLRAGFRTSTSEPDRGSFSS